MRGMAEASHHSRSYQCIKKTGYLVKSPTSGKVGRWRRRWIMLVDSIVPCPNSGYERYARMEYYDVPENCKKSRDKTTKLSALKLKGVIDLRFCIAVQPSKLKNEKSKKFMFDIITGSSSVHHFATESQCERDEWITAINEFLFTKEANNEPKPCPLIVIEDGFLPHTSFITSTVDSARENVLRTSAYLGPHPSLSRTHSTAASHSDLSLDYSYDHLHAMDDDYVYVKDSIQSVRKVSRESLRKFSSANDISIKASEYVTHIENPAQDIPSLQQQLALRYVPEIPSDNICNSEIIGSGNFSMVSKGEWNTPSGSCMVAIKHASGNNATLRMLQEAVVMVQLWHPNVVNLLGLLEKSTTIVTEMCTQGNLIYLLKALRSRMVTPPDLPSVLLKYCEHIVLGLNYLTEKGFVHRYLTAKHILVTDQNVCKISGFACSSLLSNEREFILDRDANVPVKWTAPEATMYWRFTSASMVWSFGVILYEIWSLGQEPYRQMTNSQVVEWLQDGYRLPPPPGCFRSVYEIMVACWHPDSIMRPEPSTILKYILQLDSQALPSLAGQNVPKAALELGADASVGQHLHPDLQETYLLYANAGPNNDIGGEGNKKSTTVSKQVNFNRRWSFSDDEEDNSGEDHNDYHLAEPLSLHTYVNEGSQLSSFTASPIGNMNGSRLVDLRRALATNLDGRWSLSTRGSEPNFSLDDPYVMMGDASSLRHERKRQPMSLPLSEHQSSYSNAQTHLTPRRIESDQGLYNSGGMLHYNNAATPLGVRWSEFDDDSDTDQGQNHCSARHETYHFQGRLKFGALSDSSCPLSPGDTRINGIDSKDKHNPKASRPKPPIKPRKKLPKVTDAVNSQSQTLHLSHETTITTSSSAPSLHTPKAAPRRPLLRAASIHNYETYESIDTIDQECLNGIVWTPPSDRTVPVHYYNIPSTFKAVVHDTEDHTYEQVQRYEKIQTYETIPYHFNLTTKVSGHHTQ